MPSATKVTTEDAFVAEGHPIENHGDDHRLLVNIAPDRHRIFMHFSLPRNMEGTNVSAAILRVYAKGSQTSGRRFTVNRVTQTWSEHRITWNNQPNVDTTVQPATGALPALSDGQPIEIDVTSIIQLAASGSDFFGLSLRGDTSTAPLKLYSSDSVREGKRPELDLTWSKNPLPPVDLFPSSERSVTTSTPKLRWSWRDYFGDSTQAECRIEITDPVTLASIYDSGWVTNTTQMFDTASVPTGAAAFTPLTNGRIVMWRVTVRDNDGLQSDPSDYATFSFIAPGTLTLTSPSGATVNDLTPQLAWTFGATQKFREVFVDEFNADDQKWSRVFHLPREKSTDQTLTLKEGIIKRGDITYRLRIRVWDNQNREQQQGYVAVTADFTYSRLGTPTGPVGFAAATDATPVIVFTWQDPAAGRPNFFRIWEDGTAIEKLDPNDVNDTPGSSTYSFSWYGATPKTAHTYDLAAVYNSAGNMVEGAVASITVTTEPVGVWLMDSEFDTRVMFAGQEVPDEAIGESGTTYDLIGNRIPVRVTDSIRGFEGTFSGLLIDFNGVTAKTYKNRFLKLKGRLFTDTIYLVWADRSIPVLLEDVSVVPQPPTGDYYAASFAYRQIGEFFKATH